MVKPRQMTSQIRDNSTIHNNTFYDVILQHVQIYNEVITTRM